MISYPLNNLEYMDYQQGEDDMPENANEIAGIFPDKQTTYRITVTIDIREDEMRFSELDGIVSKLITKDGFFNLKKITPSSTVAWECDVDLSDDYCEECGSTVPNVPDGEMQSRWHLSSCSLYSEKYD